MPINIPMMGRGASGDPTGGLAAAGRAATFIPPHLLDQQQVRARRCGTDTMTHNDSLASSLERVLTRGRFL